MVGKSVRLGTCVVALCFAGSVGLAQSVAVRPESAPGVTVSLDVQGVPLKEALHRIATQAGLQPAYSAAVDRSTARVTVQIHNASVASAFEQALRGSGLRAVIVADNVAFATVFGPSAPVAQGRISGKIIDGKTKEGLRGATITIDDNTKGTTSGDGGGFRFANVVPGEHTLRIRMLGYVRTSKSITVTEGQATVVDVVLEPSVSTLDQVVVTGTVVAAAQRVVPNAMTVITAKDIEQRGITHIDQLFRGDVPGLFVRNDGSNNPLDQVTMFSRGTTAFGNSPSSNNSVTNPIKTYLDGVELADPSYLSQIDPTSIERIEILTGPQASAIYGSNALNGVMQIFTKRGTTSRPQLTATVLSGLIQNNFNAATTPQHDLNAQVSGTEGHWAYNVGGSWNYVGAWTPAKQTTRQSGFGGARVQRGPLSVDFNLRLEATHNQLRGAETQAQDVLRERGVYTPRWDTGLRAPSRGTLSGQTYGVTIGYTPVSWWSHELILGRDASDVETLSLAPLYVRQADTTVGISSSTNHRTSVRYSSTAHMPVTSQGQLMLTAGADAWQSLTTGLTDYGVATLTGTLGGAPQISRQPSHNAGGFLQGQFGLWDALYLTYGLRAEWNPNYGEEAQPNVAPRYGIAYTRDMETPTGVVTAKLRASYGRSTRPPAPGQRDGIPTNEYQAQWYGLILSTIPNTDLQPEFQQGGEGGLELYFGSRASLVITRYNQTVEQLISLVNPADSARSLEPNPGYSSSALDDDGYGYTYQTQWVNVGNIRNQGWETQATVNFGPLTTKGTYSWTKSRTIGINPAYRSRFPASFYPMFQPGAMFQYLPEHTWALALTYARSATSLSLNVNGTGIFYGPLELYYRAYSRDFRLTSSRLRMQDFGNVYDGRSGGYALADLNATRRFSSAIEGILQISNLGNSYRNDNNPWYASIGRQATAGVRLKF